MRIPVPARVVGCDAMQKTMRRQRGTAHLEYFLVAIAMTIASLWLWQDTSITDAFNNTFTNQMNQIAGPVLPIP